MGTDPPSLVVRAALAVTPLQDLLGLGSASRMNVPAARPGNGVARPEDALSDAAWQRLHELTKTSGRLAGTSTESEASLTLFHP